MFHYITHCCRKPKLFLDKVVNTVTNYRNIMEDEQEKTAVIVVSSSMRSRLTKLSKRDGISQKDFAAALLDEALIPYESGDRKMVKLFQGERNQVSQ